MMEQLREMIILHEGLSLDIYRCTSGKVTVGVGHNLEDKPITKEAAMFILEDDLRDCFLDLNRNIEGWTELSDVRKAVLVDMCFNMGIGSLLKFKKFLAALKDGDYQLAASEMLDSRWSKQVGKRSERLAQMMVSNEWY